MLRELRTLGSLALETLELNSGNIEKWARCYCRNKLIKNLEAFDLRYEDFNEADITSKKLMGWGKILHWKDLIH